MCTNSFAARAVFASWSRALRIFIAAALAVSIGLPPPKLIRQSAPARSTSVAAAATVADGTC
jgi:hypothetical protein